MRGAGDGLVPFAPAAWCIHTRGNPGGRSPPPPSPRRAPPLGSPLTGCPYGSPLASLPPYPFLSPCFLPHSLGRGGGPKGLSRTATWRTGQPRSPRPDDPGPSPGTSTVGLAPVRPLGPGRGDCPLGACRRSGALEESVRRQAPLPPPPPALIALGPRQRNPGGCFAEPNCGHLACRAAPSAPSLGPPGGGFASSSPPEAPPHYPLVCLLTRGPEPWLRGRRGPDAAAAAGAKAARRRGLAAHRGPAGGVLPAEGPPGACPPTACCPPRA